MNLRPSGFGGYPRLFLEIAAPIPLPAPWASERAAWSLALQTQPSAGFGVHKFEVLCPSAYRVYRVSRVSGCQVQDLLASGCISLRFFVLVLIGLIGIIGLQAVRFRI